MSADTGSQAIGLFWQLIAAGGGGAVIAVGLFQYFGKSWIKHQLAKDLERAKAEISLLSSRRMKLHDKEYEVFPELWAWFKNDTERLEQLFDLYTNITSKGAA